MSVSELSDVLLLLSVTQRVGSHVGVQIRKLRNVFEDSNKGVEVWTPVEEGLPGGGAGGRGEPGELLVRDVEGGEGALARGVVQRPEDHPRAVAQARGLHHACLGAVPVLVGTVLAVVLRAGEGVVLTGTVAAGVVLLQHLRVRLQQVVELGLALPAAGVDAVDEAGVSVVKATVPTDVLRGGDGRLLLLDSVLSPLPGGTVEITGRAVAQLRHPAAVALLGGQQGRLERLPADILRQ